MNITQHAKERYAERILGKETKNEINLYIQENATKIEENLNKMIAYGELIYSGTSCTNKNQPVDVYMKDTWMLLVDNKYDNLITLYKVDLGCGDDFNKQYVKIMLDNIRAAKEHKCNVAAESIKKCNEYKDLVKSNENQICNLKSTIKSLELQNSSYLDLISSMHVNNSLAEQNVKDLVNELVKKKEF